MASDFYVQDNEAKIFVAGSQDITRESSKKIKGCGSRRFYGGKSLPRGVDILLNEHPGIYTDWRSNDWATGN